MPIDKSGKSVQKVVVQVVGRAHGGMTVKQLVEKLKARGVQEQSSRLEMEELVEQGKLLLDRNMRLCVKAQ